MDDLHYYSTEELVRELRKREGVETKIAEPYEILNTEIEGPAIILVIVD